MAPTTSPGTAEDKIRKRGRRAAVAVLIRLQQVFDDVVKTRQHVPQAVKDDQKTGHPDHYAKKFGRFHVVINTNIASSTCKTRVRPTGAVKPALQFAASFVLASAPFVD